MSNPGVALLGALVGIGLLTMVAAFRARPPASATRVRLRKFRAKGTRQQARKLLIENALTIVLAGALAVGGYFVTGWPVAALLGLLAGLLGPRMLRAPKRRQNVTEEIEAYSQWTEQIRDLVGASGSLYEAVVLSADNSPLRLRTAVVNMTGIARTLGLPPALDWFAAEMRSPLADRLVLGMKIAWDSGARVTEAFESTARGMRTEVEMRRRNEVANSRAWTQVIAIVSITFIAMAFMFILNRGFFAPFDSLFGQTVLLFAGLLIFGNVYWVIKLAETTPMIRLLDFDASKSDGGIGVPGAPPGDGS